MNTINKLLTLVLLTALYVPLPVKGGEPPKVVYFGLTMQSPDKNGAPSTMPAQVTQDTERQNLDELLKSSPINAPAVYYLDRARERLELARKTLELVEKIAPRPDMAAELKQLAQKIEQAALKPGGTDSQTLFAKAVSLRRRIVFSHPALDFDRLLVCKRPPAILNAPGDGFYGINNGAGPGLVVLDGWKTGQPKETALLEGKLPRGCAMQPDISFDGKKIVFAFADHRPPREQWQFFLYEIGVDGTGLRQITGTDADPLAGAGGRMTVMVEDYNPCYLPDGGIAFVSTRNQGGQRCHDGSRYAPTYLLFRCEANGSGIRQLSFGEANEWGPRVMPDGRLIWTRWDYVNRPVLPTIGLWTIRPDGTGAAHYFGNYTANPQQIQQARPIPGSHKLVATAHGHHTLMSGSLILIDRHVAEDGLSGITRLTPEVRFPETEGSTKEVRFPESEVSTTKGSFGNPYPLTPELFLAEFSPDESLQLHSQRRNAYGIYLVDTLGGRELIYRDPAISCFEPMPIRPRTMPPVLPSQLAGSVAPAMGTFYLQDVYESTQNIPRGTIKQLRVNQLLPQPTQRVPFSSRAHFELLKRVLGTVPVSEDGAVAFEAPAGMPLQFQALDKNGMAVMTMRTFTHLQPGEQAGCVGCHESRMNGSAIRPTVFKQPVRKLEPPAGPSYPGGLSFAKTVQPVLDRYCIGCHGLKEPVGKINLLGTLSVNAKDQMRSIHELIASPAYVSMTGGPLNFSSIWSPDPATFKKGALVKFAQYMYETMYSAPNDYFAHASQLAGMLLKGHHDVRLDPESWERIVNWLDLNAPFYGTYSWNKDEWRQIDPVGEKALRAAIRERFGGPLADQPFAALVNIAMPSESRILKAPLAAAAGGWGQIAQGGWKSVDDPDYRKMRDLVEAAIQPLPYHDIAGTCGRDEKCLCLSCWARKVQEERQARLGGTFATPAGQVVK